MLSLGGQTVAISASLQAARFGRMQSGRLRAPLPKAAYGSWRRGGGAHLIGRPAARGASKQAGRPASLLKAIIPGTRVGQRDANKLAASAPSSWPQLRGEAKRGALGGAKFKLAQMSENNPLREKSSKFCHSVRPCSAEAPPSSPNTVSALTTDAKLAPHLHAPFSINLRSARRVNAFAEI